MDIYKPICFRPPNKFIRKENRAFTNTDGSYGVVIVGIYEDKNGKIQEIDLYVKWNLTLEDLK